MNHKEIFNGISAVIFDLDGTIADSMYMWHQIDIDFFKMKGLTLPSDYQKKISHMSLKDIAKYTKETFNLTDSTDDIISDWINMAKEMYAHKVKLKPYAKELIMELKKEGKKLALATSTSRKLFESFLINNNVYDYFDKTLSVEEAKENKSSPKIYFEAIKDFNATPSSTLVFEDILTALTTASKAKFKTCAIYDECSKKDQDKMKEIADYYIRSFKEII